MIERVPMGIRLAMMSVVMGLSLAVISVIAWNALNEQAAASRTVLSLNAIQRLHLTNDMLHDSIKSNVYGELLMAEIDPPEAEAARLKNEREVSELRDNLQALDALVADASLDAPIAKVQLVAEEYLERTIATSALGVRDRIDAFASLPQYHASFEELRVEMENLTELLATRIKAAQAFADDASLRATQWIVGAGALGLLLCTSLLVLVCRSITVSIERVRVVAQKIANGEFEHRVEASNGNDAIGDLSVAVNEMGDSLQSMIAQLQLDASRDAFGAELSEAMEMADSEDETHQVLARAMTFVTQDRPIELLISDSSRTHLERACSHPSAGAPGCSVESPFSCVAVRRGNPVIFNDSESLNACSRLRTRNADSLSAVCIPVSFMGRSLGVLHATSSVEEPMSAEQIAQLTTIGLQAGARIGTVRAFHRTQVQASTDSMTGLANRRMAEDRIRGWLGTGETFAFVLADLDRFKQLNDTHGHHAGDQALGLFANVVRECMRDSDVASRWGGEEFVFALHGADVDVAKAWTERVRKTLASKHSTTPVIFTASFGVVDTTMVSTFEELLQRADEALYVAKKAGRDCSVIADPDSVPVTRHKSDRDESVDVTMIAQDVA